MPSIVDKPSVKKVCVDDFALRKRFSYGTVVVDLESHKIIDLIPTRNTDKVKKWLSEYPNIEVVSRDGAQLYANAAERFHPGIVQVSDRFHIIKGLTDVVAKHMIRTFPARIEIPAVSIGSEEILKLRNINNRKERIRFAHQKRLENMTINEIALLLHSSVKTVQKYLMLNPDEIENRTIVKEENHLLAMKQKPKEVDEARFLAQRGVPIEEIAKSMHHTYKTIQRYLSPDYSVEDGHYTVRIPGKLAPNEAEVIKLRSEGMTYPSIHKIISDKGYNGSAASLRMFIQKERIRNEAHWSYVKKKYKLNVTNFLCSERSLTCYFYCILLDVFKILFLIFIWRQISTVTVNAHCIVKCFDVFENQFICMCIIKDFKPIDPFSLQKCMKRFDTGIIPWICFL